MNTEDLNDNYNMSHRLQNRRGLLEQLVLKLSFL